MRFILAMMAALLMAVPQAHAARTLPEPKLIAVYFYADWCPNCKILSKAVAQARVEKELDRKDVLFVTMNLTDKPAIHQSLMLAKALGIGLFVQAQGSSTGYVAVLDGATKKELARFDRSSDAAAIGAGIETLVN